MQSVELGLLPHLEALLDTSSVSRAGERQGLSVPAMSRVLARLREQTGDALLVRAGNRMVLTPRAVVLRQSLPGALDALRRLLVKPGSERPKARRAFRVRAADAVPSLFGQQLLERLARSVDGATVAFIAEGDESVEALRSGEVDLDVGVQEMNVGPELIVRPLFRERLVGVARRGHPALKEATRLDVFCRTPHVAVSRRGIARGPIDDALHALGRRREVPITVASYLDAALLAAGGGLFALLPRVMAMGLAQTLALEVFEPPVSLPALQVAMAWHPRMKDDPLHVALRTALVELVSELGSASRPARTRRRRAP